MSERNNDTEEWVRVDAELRSNATQHSGLDAHELYWLREAERVQLWRPLGMVSMLDYMDRVLGHNPETARKRLRVARALADLPEVSARLERGELTFSAVRELTRVATPATERAWCDAIADRSSREIEELVNGRRPGDLPSDPADPEAVAHVVRFELSAATFALLRETRLQLDEEHGAHLDDNELIATLCARAMDDATAPDAHDGRAKFQIALHVCEQCDRGTQIGAGAKIAVDPATVERARCDAQHLGSIDAEHPDRAHQDIPPSVSRLVWSRDHGCCQTPGCRSARGIEIHHIVRRADGGTHGPSNLTLRCSSCHMSAHAGILTITGTAPDNLITTRNVDPRRAQSPSHSRQRHAEASPIRDEAISRQRHAEASPIRDEAIAALTTLGWKRGVAVAAVDEAMGHVAHGEPVERLIREALRRCPVARVG